MSFFKDFKADFTQAVNELIPDSGEMAGEYDDEDMVNTFDDENPKEEQAATAKKAKPAKKSKFFAAFASQDEEMIPQEEEEDTFEIAPEDLLDEIEDEDAPEQSEQMTNTEALQPAADPAPEDAQMSFDFLSNAMQVTEEQPQEQAVSEDMVGEAEQVDAAYYQPEETEDASVAAEEIPADMELVPDDMQAQPETSADGFEETPILTEQGEESTEDIPAEEVAEAEETASADNDSDYVNTLDAALPDEEETTEEFARNTVDTDTEPDTEEVQEQHESKMEDKTVVSIEEQTVQEDVGSVTETATTYITKGTKITGDIETEGSIDVIGDVIGNVNCKGKLVLGGHIEGNVSAGEIYANSARIDGDVTCEGSAKIGVGSVVVGKVAGTSAVIAGAVNGDIDVHGPVIVDSTAVIMGNIKSKSVQINNGAVIEGFCSQCYSEIDVKSFFS